MIRINLYIWGHKHEILHQSNLSAGPAPFGANKLSLRKLKLIFSCIWGNSGCFPLLCSQEAFQLASVVFVLEQWEDGGGDIQNGEEIEEAGGEDAERKEEEEEVRKNEDEGEREEDKEKEKDGGVKEEGEEKPGASETSSHLEEAATLYQKYGATLDFCAQKSVRVIVSGRLSNLGAAVIARMASSIPRTNIIAAPSLVEQRSKSVVAGKLRLNAADVEQVYNP